MPPVRNSCPLNVAPNFEFRTCRISERAPFRIYEHAQCRVFERTCLQRPYVIRAVLRARRSALVLALAASTRYLRRAHTIGRGCRVHTCDMAIGADFKMYLLRQFVRMESICYNTQETQTQKNDGPEF